MITTEQKILDMLNAGKSAEEIGVEFGNILNAAITIKKEQDKIKAEAEAKRKAEEEAKAKRAEEQKVYAQAVADALTGYLQKYCGMPGEEKLAAQDVINATEMLAGLIKGADKVAKVAPKVKVKKLTDTEVDEIFKDFFNIFGL